MFTPLRKLLVLLLFSCITLASMAGVIKGKVFDSRTHEPLVGAIIEAENGKIKYKTSVNLDGSFVFKNLPSGNYEVKAKSVGYKESKEFKVIIFSQSDIKILSDIELNDETKDLTEVSVVTVGNRKSDNYVRGLEKNADMVQNILSEKTIQLLPDVTVANALQRMSGVTIQRDNSGEGRYAIIRGMAQRYNNTLVNGIKIPSPDDKYRFVPMNMFPSDMLERLEVIKALTPNMEGDAIGGTMNLVMKSAPDKFLLSANVAGGYATLFSNRSFSAFNHAGINKQSPAEINDNSYQATSANFPLDNLHFHNLSAPINSTVGLAVGDRFLNKKMGVVVSVSYQNFYKGSNSQYLIPSSQPTVNPSANTPQFTDGFERQYSTQTNRIGIHNKIDYVFNDRNKISLYNLYLHQNDLQTRFTPDTTIGTNSSAQSKIVDIEYRSMWQIQSIYNSTLQGEHQLSNKVKLDWSTVYSYAKNQVPDMALYTYHDSVGFDNSGKLSKVNHTTQGTHMNRTWQHNSDQDLAAYANVTYLPVLFNRTVEFLGGGLYRYKTRDNYKNEYDLVPNYTAAQPYTSIDQVPFYFSPSANGTGAVTAVNNNSYTVHENIAAGYVQAKFMLLRDLQVLGGVRVENTYQNYTTVMPITSNLRSGTIQYTDVLPSVHFKYLLTSKQNLRLSYFKSISRPGFGEITPYSNPGEEFTEKGNPYLKHTRADNLDLRYELFPGGADQLLLGAFYKKLENPIEYFVTSEGGATSAQIIIPGNVNSATNYGFEAVVTKYFGMFGVSANYTYTHSEVTTKKLLYHFVPGVGNQKDSTFQTRPLQGQANHVGNISLLYKNPKIGLEMQLALAYTGDRIAQVSQYANLDFWQKPFTQLDFSLEQRLSKQFHFYTKINNLTNAPNKQYIKYPYSTINRQSSGNYVLPFQDAGKNYTIVQKDIYNLNFLVGVKYKF
jgi:outer membrane receptor protein involved in Fe transport